MLLSEMKSSEKKVWRTTSFVLQFSFKVDDDAFVATCSGFPNPFYSYIHSKSDSLITGITMYYLLVAIPAQVKVLILKSTNNFCRIFSQDLSSKTLPLWKTSVTFAKCSKTCIRVRVRVHTCLYIHMPTCTLRRKQGCLLRPLFRPFILRIVADQTLRKSPVKRKRER